MPRPGKKITLPENDDMLRRLRSVNSEQYLVARFYPIVLRRAGETNIDGVGLIELLVGAIRQFTSTQSAVHMLYGLMMEYIKALVDDTQVQNEAEAEYRARGLDRF